MKSAYDGFYLFSKVLPGAYVIRVSPEQMQRLGLRLVKEGHAEIQGEESIISEVDLTLEQVRP